MNGRADRRWPPPGDMAAADRLIERFADCGPVQRRLAARPGGRSALAALGGNSPYLADLALRESRTLIATIRRGPDAVVAEVLEGLRATRPNIAKPEIARALRVAKRRVALATALGDLGGEWSLPQVMRVLSELAEAALRLAVTHLLLAAHTAGRLHMPDPARPTRRCGFVVLGMGKLGAGELNYSSDVDLVLIFDPDAHAYHGSDLSTVFTRLARDLVTLMEARDPDGYVFRVDLRLRPDPAATPPAVALPTALAYYERMGRNWERAAMIKARPVAGDLDLGARFLHAIHPFIWRRHLDFSAIADIRAARRGIEAQQASPVSDGSPATRLAGRDLKLGRGGIREIEFIAQTLQLVWGGRDPSLRAPQTLAALTCLAAAGHLPSRTAATLCRCYEMLRQVEHRLQMVADRQTHAMPPTEAAVLAIAPFLQAADRSCTRDQVAAELLETVDHVRAAYEALFEALPLPLTPALPEQLPALAERLAAFGYAEPARAAEMVRAWRAGTPRALRAERARDLLEDLLPSLLAALADVTDAPDLALDRFDRMLHRLSGGVQLLAVLERQPVLLRRIAGVLGAAPTLAEHLASVPAALDGLLAPSEIDPEPTRSLRIQLAHASGPPGLERALLAARRYVRGEEFRLSVGEFEGRLDVDQAGAARSALASACLATLLPEVLRAHVARYGRVPGGGVAVVALGKLGGRAMMTGSDLDLMLLYDAPETVTESLGRRPISVPQYYIRLAHGLVAALTAPGADGALYEVDMRLRPSGSKGPVAVPLAGFVRYHASSAWTWERMALTRARVVVATPGLRRRIEGALRQALAGADALRVAADAASMRGRMLREAPPRGPWDAKLRPGGLIEVEFIVQVLQLLHARDTRPPLDPNTGHALRRLARAGAMPAALASRLQAADRCWRTVQGMLRLTLGQQVPSDIPSETAEGLAHALNATTRDPQGLRGMLDEVAEEVRAAFLRYVGNPENQQ